MCLRAAVNKSLYWWSETDGDVGGYFGVGGPYPPQGFLSMAGF